MNIIAQPTEKIKTTELPGALTATLGGVEPAQGAGVQTSAPSLPQMARDELATWLGQHKWDWFATLTFREMFSAASAWRAWARWSQAHFPAGGWFAAMEFTERGGKQVPHLHTLVNCDAAQDAEAEFRAILHDPHNSQAWRHWVKRYGRAKIENYIPAKGADHYVAKYVTKDAIDRGGWDVGGCWQTSAG